MFVEFDEVHWLIIADCSCKAAVVLSGMLANATQGTRNSECYTDICLLVEHLLFIAALSLVIKPILNIPYTRIIRLTYFKEANSPTGGTSR